MLFDLDGTLFDHEGAARRALEAWLPSVGMTVSATSITAWFAAEERRVGEWRSGLLTWDEQRRARLRDVLPQASTWTAERLDAVFAGYLVEYEAAWRAFPDVDDALRALAARDIRLGILSNGAAAQQRAKLTAVGLGDRFEFVLTTEDLGTSKPDPEAYLAACRSFGLRPSQVLHVGDLPDLDVDAPRGAGLRAVLVDRDGRHRDPEALRSLRALPGRLVATGN